MHKYFNLESPILNSGNRKLKVKKIMIKSIYIFNNFNYVEVQNLSGKKIGVKFNYDFIEPD